MLAGFEVPTPRLDSSGGALHREGADHKRDIGMVFQSYALLPHMTVEENLAFPRKVRNLGKVEIQAKIIRLGAYGKRRPAPDFGRPAAARRARSRPRLRSQTCF